MNGFRFSLNYCTIIATLCNFRSSWELCTTLPRFFIYCATYVIYTSGVFTSFVLWCTPPAGRTTATRWTYFYFFYFFQNPFLKILFFLFREFSLCSFLWLFFYVYIYPKWMNILIYPLKAFLSDFRVLGRYFPYLV